MRLSELSHAIGGLSPVPGAEAAHERVLVLSLRHLGSPNSFRSKSIRLFWVVTTQIVIARS